MNRLKEIIYTVSVFLMIPVLLTILVVPTLIVTNLSPVARKEEFVVERKNKTILGSQSILLSDVEIRVNDEILKASPIIRNNQHIISLSVIHSSNSKHTVFADSILLKNRSDKGKKVYFIPKLEALPSDIEIAVIVDDVSNVIVDSNGNYWPQEIFLVPGQELLIGFRIDGRYEIHTDLDISIEISAR